MRLTAVVGLRPQLPARQLKPCHDSFPGETNVFPEAIPSEKVDMTINPARRDPQALGNFWHSQDFVRNIRHGRLSLVDAATDSMPPAAPVDKRDDRNKQDQECL
jgi:hypothetical protein